MKKIIFTLTSIFISTIALADFTFIVPQKPGGGTDLWAKTIAQELEKKLDERIVIKNIPGINDIPGFNAFHNELQFDYKTVMVSHGGNAESFLVDDVDYDYFQYQPIALQNLTIMVGRNVKENQFNHVKFAAGSGMNPDALAITMLICGPDKTLEQYKECFDEKFTYVKGMSGSERRLAYMRGELNVTRENPLAYKKHAEKVQENVNWFSNGVLDLETGQVINDKNFPKLTFQQVFKEKWGVEPSGEFYQAYLLVKSYRDALQKSLWVGKDNPNTLRLQQAVREIVEDKEALSRIYAKTGEYEFIIGNDVYKVLGTLNRLKTQENLKNLKWIIDNMLSNSN